MSVESEAPPLAPCPFCGADHDETVFRCPTTDMSLPFEGRLLAGKFRFLSELGRGGMGAVWLARNVHVDRDVALKLILPEVSKNPEIVARFQTEARVAARIGHAGICDILDLEVTPLGPVIVMELLRGESLGDRLARERRLPIHLAVGIVREALVALDAAHRAGVIHRDLKPENIFLHQPDDEALVVKLMDFGISKLIDRSEALTAHGAIMGTPEYMAPEQVGGAVHADARTDVWAMGAVLYKALTGVDAFAGATFPATVLAIVSADPAPLETHLDAVPPGLTAVVMRCLAKNPDDRFQSAPELADALEPFAQDGPTAPAVSADPVVFGSLPTLPPGASRPTILAPPEPARAPSRWLRRLVTFALLGGLAYGTWYFVRGPGASDPDVASIVEGVSNLGERLGVAATNALPAINASSDMPKEPAKDTGPQPGQASAAAASETAPSDGSGTEGAPEDGGTTTGGEPETGGDTTGPATTGDPKPPAPPPLIAAAGLVTPSAVGKVGNQHWAREYCAALDRNKYLGISTWKLANPGEAKKFAGVAGLRSGAYWTSAAHKGRALVVYLPKGSDASVRVTKKSARPLCVSPKR